MNVVEKAKMVAHWFHAGQTDMANKPYVGHLERVAVPFHYPSFPVAEAVAWLHDVVEDTPCTLADLQELGFQSEIIQAVEAITQRKGEALEDYWSRVRANPLARAVKVKGDIPDNADPMRLEHLPPHLQEKLTLKYQRAMDFLGYDHE
jgi:(p)ppGpp synthase/HD superfamily hydrolase